MKRETQIRNLQLLKKNEKKISEKILCLQAYEEYGNYVTSNQLSDISSQQEKGSLSFGALFQSGISHNSNSQSQNSQSEIEKAQIIDIKTHNFILNNNKLITQKDNATINPHTSIIGLNLSTAKGMTMEASAIWPMSAQISDSLSNWRSVNCK